MIISLPALGIMIKINMPKVRKMIYKQTLPHITLVVVFRPTAVAGVASMNSYLKYGFVPPHRISLYLIKYFLLILV